MQLNNDEGNIGIITEEREQEVKVKKEIEENESNV